MKPILPTRTGITGALLCCWLALALAASATDFTAKLAPLIDPAKLATLGQRGANPRTGSSEHQVAVTPCCSAPLNRGSFLVTCADHRPAIKTLRAIIAEVGLEPVSQIFWLDTSEGIWRCAYPNPSLRLSVSAIRADIAHELAVADLALRQCAHALALLKFGRGLPARLRALASAFRSRL